MILTNDWRKETRHVLLCILYLFCFSFGTIVAFSKIADTDAYFLIVNGQEILQAGKVPTTLLNTIHSGFTTIIQQWIVSLINVGIYNAFGFRGLPIYSFIVYCIDLILFNLLVKENGVKGDGRIVLNGIAAVLLSPFATSRPSILSIAIITIELIVLTKFNKSDNQKIGLLLPVIAFVEVNIHAALWWLVPIFALPYLFPIKGRAKKSLFLLGCMAAMFPATLLNPNGINGTLYLVKSYSAANGGLQIAELAYPVFLSPASISLWTAIACISIYFYKYKKVKEEYLAAEFLAAGTLILGVLHYRDTWMTLLGIVPLFSIVFESENNEEEQSPKLNKKTKIFYSSIIISITVLACFTKLTTNEKIEDTSITPIKAMEYIKEKNGDNTNVNVFTEFGTGAFVELNGYKSYIDARPELFQKTINGKKDVYTEYCNLLKGKLDFKEFVNSYDFNYLIVDDNTCFSTYLSFDENYKLVIDSKGYNLYEHVYN